MINEIQNFDYPSDMDKECIDMCNLFNSIGLKTEFSCCGHQKCPFEIIFANSVSTNQIDAFLNKLKGKYNHTPLLGRFVMWARKVNGVVTHTWMYSVPNIEWAKTDYEVMLHQFLKIKTGVSNEKRNNNRKRGL